jgi:hypothetical protein
MMTTTIATLQSIEAFPIQGFKTRTTNAAEGSLQPQKLARREASSLPQWAHRLADMAHFSHYHFHRIY